MKNAFRDNRPSDSKINETLQDEATTRIGGVEIQYYYTCHRELWFKLQQIAPPQDDSNLVIGTQIHNRSYQKYTRREVNIGGAKIDLIISGNTARVIEIKKSSKMLKPTKRQLQYYLWLLEKQGLDIQGEIRVPTEKKIIPVKLDQRVREELVGAVEQISIIALQSSPPRYEKKPYCTRCAYRPICEA